jgi:hypothetical protein
MTNAIDLPAIIDQILLNALQSDLDARTKLDNGLYAFFREQLKLPVSEASQLTDTLLWSELVVARLDEFCL